MDLFDALSAFVRTAERGGFAAAARDLNVSQPHVTRALQQLEARLGTRLMHRTTRRVTLTDEGQEYLEHARQILSAVENADHAVGQRARQLSGRLRVFAPVSLGRRWVVAWAAEFMAQHAGVDVELVLDDRPRDLVEERLDIGIRVGDLRDSTLVARRLGEVERLIVAAPSYWSERGAPRQPADLAAHTALIFAGTITLDRLHLVRGGAQEQVALRGRLRTNSSEAIEEAALRGHGFMAAPTWLIDHHLAAGRLVQVLQDWRVMPPLAISATYPPTRAPTEKVRRFVDGFAWRLQAQGAWGPRPPGSP